jgi:hypothetical protein
VFPFCRRDYGGGIISNPPPHGGYQTTANGHEIKLNVGGSVIGSNKYDGIRHDRGRDYDPYDITGSTGIGANCPLNIEALVSLPCLNFSYTICQPLVVAITKCLLKLRISGIGLMYV